MIRFKRGKGSYVSLKRNIFSLLSCPFVDLKINRLEQLQKILLVDSDFEVVTFDVFDTLIERPKRSAENVIDKICNRWAKTISRELNLSIHGKEVYQTRIRVEKKLREGSCYNGLDGEVRIDDLVSGVCDEFNLGYESKAQLLDIEIATEIEELSLIAGAFEILKDLAASNIRLFAISDMYLGGKNINIILSNFGILNFFENVYVSSDYGLVKGTGRLFEVFLNDYRVDKSKWIHVGDNIFSDKKSVEKIGGRSILFFAFNKALTAIARDIRDILNSFG